MANGMTYGQEQAQKNLSYWQGLGGQMRPPSAFASPEEREAYAAQQVKAGELPSSSLSEAYGGRPQGTTRRAIRMQEQWDKQRAAQIEEARSLQAMDIEQKQFEMGLRDQQMQEDDFYYNRGIKEAEQKLQSQQRSEATAIINGLNQLDPRSPDYQKNVATIFGNNPLGASDPNVQKIAEQYGAANEMYVGSSEKRAAQQKSWLIGQQEEAYSLGVDTSEFFTTEVDPNTGETIVSGVDELGLSKAVGEAKRNDFIKKQKEISEAKVGEEIRSEAKDVLKGIQDIDKQIREQNFMASREKSETNRDEYLAKVEYLRQERDILVARYNNLIPKKQEDVQPQQGTKQPRGEKEQQPETTKTNIKLPEDWEKMKSQEKVGIVMDILGSKSGSGSSAEYNPSGIDILDVIINKNDEKSAIEKASMLGYSQKKSTIDEENKYKIINFVLEKNNKPSEELIVKIELSKQDQAALNWASANPNDPRSQRIKAKLGVQ